MPAVLRGIIPNVRVTAGGCPNGDSSVQPTRKYRPSVCRSRPIRKMNSLTSAAQQLSQKHEDPAGFELGLWEMFVTFGIPRPNRWTKGRTLSALQQ